MKNKDILLDVIGDTDEKLVPDLTVKKNSILKRTILGGVCAAAVIAGITILPKAWNDTEITPSDNIGSKDDTGNTSSGNISNTNDTDNTPSAIISNHAMLLAAATYPEMPAYPDETAYTDWNTYETVFHEWDEARQTLRKQPDGYQDGFDTFFFNTTQTFLTGPGNENVVYSPLSLYMALGMSAEMTDGNSRQQILDVLAQKDIDTLRSHSKSIWQSTYMDDGMAKCILANSLWTNSNVNYKQDTIDRIADTYYSSVYSGDPVSDDYSNMLQNWLNEQTDGLLNDYVSDIKMDPDMVLTLASTVNYSGKWKDKFSVENTKQSIFHAAGGDIQYDYMNAERDMIYYWGDNFSSVSLPLENNGHMKLILPDEGYSPNDLLNDEQVKELMLSTWDYPNNRYMLVNMSIPKFDISSNIDLREGLNKLGITDIFDSDSSDFTPLTDSSDGIYLSKAEQDTRVMIDEEGCKASSLAIIMYAGAGIPGEQVDFILDRPFIIEIMSDTGLPLFVGIVNNPVQ